MKGHLGGWMLILMGVLFMAGSLLSKQPFIYYIDASVFTLVGVLTFIIPNG